MILLSYFIFFFFFKQKTAYEMRISDWSSDVCSSDLGRPRAREPEQLFRIPNPESPTPALKNEDTDMAHFELVEKMAPNANIKVIGVGGGGGNAVAHMVNSSVDGVEFITANTDSRSEEHTSELQSLMRISYAVFCLK